MGYIIHSNKKCCMCTNESSHMERSQHDYPMNTHTHTHTNHHHHHHHPCDDYDSWKEISEQGSIAIHDIVTCNSYFRQQSSNRGPLSTFWHQSGTIVFLPIGYLGNDSFHSTHKSCDKWETLLTIALYLCWEWCVNICYWQRTLVLLDFRCDYQNTVIIQQTRIFNSFLSSIDYPTLLNQCPTLSFMAITSVIPTTDSFTRVLLVGFRWKALYIFNVSTV